MKYLDLTLPAPAQNLACDEALLDTCQAGGGEILRFWEPTDYFVVVGYANPVATEVHLAACEAAHIPVLRRCSGGGTVLQGPGCLNYSLILKTTASGLDNVSSTNRLIMELHRSAFERLFAAKVEIAVRGDTDLAMDGRKFSGNAQRRTKNALLFHGTFLLQFDLSRMENFLPMPARRPDYRQNRSHQDFLTNVPLPADSVKRALREAWQANEPLEVVPDKTIASLSRDKYVTKEWNFKF
jgi:lipoate-protein ligase A